MFKHLLWQKETIYAVVKMMIFAPIARDAECVIFGCWLNRKELLSFQKWWNKGIITFQSSPRTTNNNPLGTVVYECGLRWNCGRRIKCFNVKTFTLHCISHIHTHKIFIIIFVFIFILFLPHSKSGFLLFFFFFALHRTRKVFLFTPCSREEIELKSMVLFVC